MKKMASKIYTAQEMRNFADAIAADLNDCGHTSVTYGFDDLLPIIQCLRHSAEVVERCEKVIAKCNEAKDMNSPTWNFDKQAFAMDLYEVINYIIRGDAGNDNENK